MEKKKLKDCFENLIVGETMSRRQSYEENSLEVKVLTPKAICEGYIDDNGITTYKIKNTKFQIKANKYTKSNDIIVKLTPPYNAVLIDKDHEGLLVPQFCVILRDVKPIISKEYEKFIEDNSFYKEFDNNEKYLSFIISFLNTQHKYFEDVSKSDIKSISKTVIGNLDIPICSYDNMEKINIAFKSMSNAYKYTRQLISYHKEYMEALLDDTLNDDLNDELYVNYLKGE